MTSSTYRVVTNGGIVPGYEKDLVATKFAEIFKLTPEKASAVVGNKGVLQKGITLELARTYHKKLSGIGLGVDIQEEVPKVVSSPPTAAKPSSAALSLAGIEPTKEVAAKTTGGMVCPKCDLEQPKAEECQQCGVIVDKVRPRTEQSVADPDQGRESVGLPVEKNSNQLMAFGAPAIIALCGALLWYWVGVTFGFEFALVAWLIGGAVGFSAAAFGAKGELAGIICGVLVVVSILGGKYMTAASYKNQFVEQFTTMTDGGGSELQAVYEEYLNDAKVFSETVTDDDSLRQFMVTGGFTEFEDPSEITDEEIEDFKVSVQPEIESMAINQPSFEQWRETAFTLDADYSTFELMMDGLGLLDVLFLFLGVGTAFRLAKGDT